MPGLTGTRLSLEIGRQTTLAQNVLKTQIQIATGKRIERASDDPGAAARIADLVRSQGNVESWASNVSLGQSLAAHADSILSQLSDRVVQAQSAYISAGDSALGADYRAGVAAELRSFASEIDEMAATKSSLDQPLFASSGNSRIPVGDGLTIAPVPSASEVFQTGGVSLSQQLRDAAAALEMTDPQQRAAAYAQSTQQLGAMVAHVATVHSDVGVRANRLDALQNRLATQKIDLASERSGLEDTDITLAVAQLNSQQLTLEAAQAAFARISKQTLFDILR
jgi:flagellar hook-associated protein 3 FlgL